MRLPGLVREGVFGLNGGFVDPAVVVQTHLDDPWQLSEVDRNDLARIDYGYGLNVSKGRQQT